MELELVSGFMIEYVVVIFVFFFLVEYVSIVLMCIFISILFLGGYLIDIYLIYLFDIINSIYVYLFDIDWLEFIIYIKFRE